MSHLPFTRECLREVLSVIMPLGIVVKGSTIENSICLFQGQLVETSVVLETIPLPFRES